MPTVAEGIAQGTLSNKLFLQMKADYETDKEGCIVEKVCDIMSLWVFRMLTGKFGRLRMSHLPR